MVARGTNPADLGIEDLQKCDRDSRISFTLPLALPEARAGVKGSGLNYVEYDLDDCEHAAKRKTRHLCGRWRREAYELGTLVVHSHGLLHQIGEWDYASWSTNRVTLQGFGFQCAGVWWLYW